MNNSPDISIIITTRDRAAYLNETLTHLQTVNVPSAWRVETLVVDNGSKDDTRQVTERYANATLPTTYLYEPEPGQTQARNAAVQAARGTALLWTDDDVAVPPDWIERMCLPLLEGKTDSVSGKIRMASGLERPWMTRTHYDRLADTRFMGDHFGALIGANMAFHRRVLEKIPAFDPELGPGKMGFMDDSLYSLMIHEAGYRMISVGDAEVTHHFEPSRLQYRSWLKNGEANGRSQAYVHHHWQHEPLKNAALDRIKWASLLHAFRLYQRPPGDGTQEGCDRREIRMVQKWAFADQFLKERGTARKYERRGLTKKS